MRILVLFLVLCGLFVVIGVSMHRGMEGAIDRDWEGTVYVEPLDIDPLPVTEMKFLGAEITGVNLFPDDEQLKLIGRITEGVHKVALQKGGGNWWRCGRKLTEMEQQNHAMAWGYRIVYLAWEYSDNGSDGGRIINPWEIAGTAANESGFDVCALGPWVRKEGYQRKTMKRSRLSISQTMEEVVKTLDNPKSARRWKTIGIDASPLQILWRCSGGKCAPKWNPEGLPPIPYSEVFSLAKGFEYGVRRMKRDSRVYRTKHPTLYWRGYKAEWYLQKVKNWARRLGAKPEELW